MTIHETKELYREKPEDKLGILDLELDINDKEKVDVEVQLIERENFAERLLYYFSRLYGGEIKKGKDYTESKRVLIVAIVDYEIMNKNEDIKDAIITVHEMSEDEKIRKLAELREKAIMDEKAIRKAGYRRGMEKGLEDGKKIGIEQGIEQGMERGIKQGIKEGIKQGIEKGERKQKEEIAKKLKAMKISLNQIKEATGLSEDEINNL